MKTLRIANAAGFWGDNLDAPRLTLEACGTDPAARLDYLTLEYLAELTMSILARQRSRDPQAGYVTDFSTVLESVLFHLQAQPNLRIVTNAGGVNPTECARRCSEILCAAELDDLAVGAVAGDDLTGELDRLLNDGEEFANLETGEPLGELRDRVVAANAYLGADGIVEALAGGARIVVTGRVADASLTVGPAVYEFGWEWNDWDRLAAATVAGHLIECGAQMTGGMYSDWSVDLSLADVGYPIAEVSEDGAIVVTKPLVSGGLVSTGTVAEQLVYEIGDPAHYLTPDVDADFQHVTLEEVRPNRVAVQNARGRPAPERYKVSLCYHDGYTAAGTLVIGGPQAVQKAAAAASIVGQRVGRAGFSIQRMDTEILGAGSSVPGVIPRAADPPEVVLRLSVHDPSRDAVERFTRELAPLVTSGPPGVSGYTGPRPKPQPVLAYWPTTIARERVSPVVTVQKAKEWLA